MKIVTKTYLGFIAYVSLLFSFLALGNVVAKDQSWGAIPDTSARFKSLANLNHEAVLDRETGLIWQQCPPGGRASWGSAFSSCLRRMIGGRGGWRLPTTDELTSLNEGLGFANFSPSPFCSDATLEIDYWSSTEITVIDEFGNEDRRAYYVRQDPSIPPQFETPIGIEKKDQSHRFWCVRGGQK